MVKKSKAITSNFNWGYHIKLNSLRCVLKTIQGCIVGTVSCSVFVTKQKEKQEKELTERKDLKNVEEEIQELREHLLIKKPTHTADKEN